MQKWRVFALLGVLVLVGAVLGTVGLIEQRRVAQIPAATPQPGRIHLYVDGVFRANIAPDDLKALPAASFTDLEQGKPQEGWWLRDVVRLYVPETSLSSQSSIRVTGLSKDGLGKVAGITWAEALEPANNVAFDLAGDGQSVKLASTLERLSTRNDWVQGVSRLDIHTKP